MQKPAPTAAPEITLSMKNTIFLRHASAISGSAFTNSSKMGVMITDN